MPQKITEEKSKSMHTSPCNPCNRLREKQRWFLNMEYVQPSKEYKKILHNPITFWPQMCPSPEPRHMKPNSSAPKVPAPCPPSALPVDTGVAPELAQAQLNYNLGSHFFPNLLICEFIQSSTLFPKKSLITTIKKVIPLRRELIR